MNHCYKLVFDTGKIFYVIAKTRGKALKKFCDEHGIKEKWVNDHCRIKLVGRADNGN